jgi:hypothetical protein
VSFDWIRKNYGVPAKKGGRVEYTGDAAGAPKLGTITGAEGGHVMIKLDGQKNSLPYHPTWELRYLDAAAA